MAGAAALGLVAVPAEAITTAGTGALKAAPTTDVEKAHWYGRRYRYRPYYGYGPRFHYGPRYGYRHHYYRPGFRFYYGPRYRHRHYRYRNW
jgi:hypothetical protein